MAATGFTLCANEPCVRSHTGMVRPEQAADLYCVASSTLQGSCPDVTVRTSVMDVSVRGLTLYAIWAGHQVSDLDSPVIALNRWCQALPCHSQQKPTLRIVSMFAPQDEHATPAHARNHAKDVNGLNRCIKACFAAYQRLTWHSVRTKDVATPTRRGSEHQPDFGFGMQTLSPHILSPR